MKKTLTTILSALLLVTATGCGDKETEVTNNNSTDKTSQLEIVKVEGDRVVYYDFDSLDASADLVVIGSYKNDSTQNLEYEYSSEFGKDVLVNAVSTNEIEVSRVLKGTTDEDSLKISQRYGILDEPYQLVTFSEMTAMEKGDEWIFFLYYDDSNDTYWCSGDYTGRYPLPDDSLTAVCNEVNQIREERENWLSGKQTDVTANANNDYVYTSVDGSEYSFTAQADIDKVKSFDERISSSLGEVDASDFGVYEKNLINIELYCDIINQYDCTL